MRTSLTRARLAGLFVLPSQRLARECCKPAGKQARDVYVQSANTTEPANIQKARVGVHDFGLHRGLHTAIVSTSINHQHSFYWIPSRRPSSPKQTPLTHQNRTPPLPSREIMLLIPLLSSICVLLVKSVALGAFVYYIRDY